MVTSTALSAMFACAPVVEASGPTATQTIAAPTPPDSTIWSYRAGGTEPFWTFFVEDIEAGWTLTRLGQPDVTGELSHLRRDDDVPTLRGRSANGVALTLKAVAKVCSLGMGDRSFAHTVTLALGTHQLSGCGGGVIPSYVLDESAWSISTVNGVRTTPGGQIRFGKNQMQVTGWCPDVVYEIADVEPLGFTIIGDGEPQMMCYANTWAPEVARLLRTRVLVIQSQPDTMTLEANDMTVVLRRLP